MDDNSLVSTMERRLDLSKLVRWTNKAQALILTLASDELVPEGARAAYEEANEALKKAMRIAHDVSRKQR